MNVMLNRLPTRTWNRLNMNESVLAVEGEFENHTPEASFDPAGVSFRPDAPWNDPASAYALSPDLTALTGKAKTALVETEEGQSMASPMVLRYLYKEGEQAVSRLVLHAGKNSTMSVVLLLTSPAQSRDVSVLQVEVRAEENAKVRLCAAQLMGEESLCINELSGICEENAQVELVRLELGAARAYTGASMDLAGRESSFRTNIGYHAKAEQLLDMNYVALHHGQRTESLMEVSGTMEENSQKIFRGTIDFRKGCGGSKGTENENVLLMGEEMVNQTIPLILCKEEDVEGNHGASIGQLDDKVLFYLGARGISPEQAQRLIARSRIEAVCAMIPDGEIRQLVHNFEHQEETPDEEL